MASIQDEVKRIREQEARERRKALMQKQQKNLSIGAKLAPGAAVGPGAASMSTPASVAAPSGATKAAAPVTAVGAVPRSSAQQRDFLTRGPPRNVFEACEAGDKVALDKFVGMGRFNVEAKDINGRTCLHWAAEAGHIGIIDFLVLEHGADITNKDVHNGRTAVHMAARRGHAKALRYVLSMLDQEKAELLVNEVDARGCTPAFLAYEAGPDGEDAFKLLLEYGARWNALDLDEQMRRVQDTARENSERRRFEEAMERLEGEANHGTSVAHMSDHVSSMTL